MITGKSGSGKTTTADIFVEYGFAQHTFAGPIKDIAKIIGFSHEEVCGTQENKLKTNEFWDISGREFMQQFGTDMCRDVIPKMKMNGRTIWARIMEQKIIENPFVVIGDGRFPDEAQLVREHGGIIIRVVRDVVNHNERAEHKSEASIDEIDTDIVIDNNGTVDELRERVKQILEEKSYGFF